MTTAAARGTEEQVVPGDGLHPRPQLTRPRWFDLSGWWGFAYDDRGRGLDEAWHDDARVFDRRIRVPFPPESAASGVGDTGYHPIVWYRRTFADVRENPDERLLLHCGAVDYAASVWVNGALVATHEGGQTPFTADITAACGGGTCHTIVIRAEDSPHDLGQPRGKQDWLEEPHDIWYHRTTGIWQPVWLEPVPSVHVERLRWEPDPAQGRVRLTVVLNRAPDAGLSVELRLHRQETLVGSAGCPAEARETTLELRLGAEDGTPVAADLLWSPDDPTLLDAEITLRSGDAEIDAVGSYVGLRTVAVDDDRFMLNDRPVYLRMVLHQGYWPDTHLASPTPDHLRREVELIRELGFNGVRVHQKVEDPRFLYWCDRLGLIVWGEMANAFSFSTSAALRLTREWVEVLARDVDHPCIVAWVPLNESWGVPELADVAEQQSFVRALYFLTKAIDPSRLVVANDGWEYLCGDLVTVHDYTQDVDTLRARYGSAAGIAQTLESSVGGDRRVMLSADGRNRPVMLTEFGGISLRPEPDDPWFGYGTVDTLEEFRERLARLFAAVDACGPLAGFCYTQLTDTLQETNGLVTADRRPKLDPAVIRGIVQGAG